jgi:TetR/AcrR family transcriptional regulator, transcriptional repressor for nem operon
MDAKPVKRPDSGLRDRILVTLIDTVVERGYAATSIADICALCNVTKGAFFHHFTTKEGAVLAALDTYCAWREGRDSAALTKTKTPRERFFALFETAVSVDTLRPRGCFLGVLAMEALAMPAALQRRCDEEMARSRNLFIERLRGAAPHLSNTELDVASLIFQATFHGAFVVARASGDFRRVRVAMNYLRDEAERIWLPPTFAPTRAFATSKPLERGTALKAVERTSSKPPERVSSKPPERVSSKPPERVSSKPPERV